MRTMAAGEFKAKCLAVIDEVNATGEPLLITKRASQWRGFAFTNRTLRAPHLFSAACGTWGNPWRYRDFRVYR